MTNTAFSADDPSRVFAPLVVLMRPFMKSPERGAETPVYLSSSPDVQGVTGQYFANRKTKRSNESSYDTAITGRLWEVSSKLVRLQAEGSAGSQ
jgi:hypothetical protein